jgi:hypothetical protein
MQKGHGSREFVMDPCPAFHETLTSCSDGRNGRHNSA